MSVQSRYDALLKDMIILMQEALYRFFTNKQVDLNKFKQYFTNFYKKMINLEDEFHAKCVKFSKAMNKLTELFVKAQMTATFSLQPTPLKVTQPQQYLAKPRISQNHTSLKIIGQQQQQIFEKERERRSGTAEGRRRSDKLVIDFSRVHYRPKTGISRQSSRRYKSIDLNNINNINYPTHQTLTNEGETIAYNENYLRTGKSKDLDEENTEYKKERKSFYNELEKQQLIKQQIIYQNMVKIPKKRSISTHRWSFKINKLF